MDWRPAALAPVLLASGLATAQERGDVPTFSSQVDLVTVDAVVLDDDGELVRGLSAADFALFEDGRPQPIASFEAVDVETRAADGRAPRAPGPVATNLREGPPPGRPLVLLIDDLSLAPSRQIDVRRAIERFLAEGLRDGDELIFATTSGDVWWSARFPEGGEDLLALAARVRGRRLSDTAPDAVSEWEAFRIVHVEGMEDGTRNESGPSPQGPPSRAIPSPTYLPGNMSERVRQRFMERLVCDPLQPAASCYAMVRSRAQQVDVRRRNRTRDTLAAVDRAIFALTGIRGRKSLLLLTEGFLSDPDLGMVQEVAGRCREANIAVYSVDVRGLIAGNEGLAATARDAPYDAELAVRRAEVVELEAAGSVGLAEDTGGFAVRNTNDLAGGASRAAQESRVHYLLGYVPPTDKSPLDWRKLKVEVRRPGLKVRARKGYTLRNAAEMAEAARAQIVAGSDPKPALPVEVARAIANNHDTDGIPLRAMAYTLDDRPGGAVRTVIAVEADTRALANLAGAERPRAVVTLTVTATHRDTGKRRQVAEHAEVDASSAQAWEGWLVLARELDLTPGVNQARVVVRDEFLGRVGALTLRFVVPPPGSLRISTPVLTNRVSAANGVAPPRPVLVARREFAPVGPLYCQFQVFGGSRVEASVDLVRRDGEVVRRSGASPIAPAADGRLVRLVALPLDGVEEGEYDVVIRIEDMATGGKTERIEALRISARAS